MSSVAARQVLCGPFNSGDLPDYQAAIQHMRIHWRRLLSVTQLEIVEAIMDRTVRFGKRSKRMNTEWFQDGHASNGENYAGCAPITPVSRQAFSKAMSALTRIGIVIKTGRTYAIDYSITIMDLATDADVQKRVLAENRRGGILSTLEGMLEWAAAALDKYLNPVVNKDEEASTYTFTPTKTQPSDNKLSETMGSYFLTRVRDYIMGNRTAAQIMADVHTSVAAGREKVQAKRKTRRTLADSCALFETEWANGQRDRDSAMPVSRIVGKDRALLKQHILKRAEGTELDTDAFAYWVANNWQAIGASYFAKAKSYPERPVMPWLVKCFDTYVIAYQQKDTLDTEGTRSQTELLKRAAQTTQVQEAGKNVAEAKDKELAIVKAQLAEANRLLAKKGQSANPDLDAESQAIVAKGKRMSFPDYDDVPTPKPKRRVKRTFK